MNRAIHTCQKGGVLSCLTVVKFLTNSALQKCELNYKPVR